MNFVPPVISLVVFFIIVNYLFTNETANLKHPVLTGIVLSLGTQFFLKTSAFISHSLQLLYVFILGKPER